MEDRYLFKAKGVDDGEWVQGCYIYNIDRDCSESLNKFAHRIQPLYAHAYAEPIDPTTICQCTGLNDKNGKLIWENDIMVAHLDDEYPEDETYIRILWRGSGFCSKENGSEDIAPIDKFDREHFEVCGNIFDNKDLLEKEFFE